MNETNLGDVAQKSAQEIYELCSQCLMAHSIRAVELVVQKRVLNYTVIIRLGSHVQEMAGKRALVDIDFGRSVIYVEKAITFDEQRMAVAHELGHILLAFHMHKPGDKLSRLPGKMANDAAGVFEHDLCLKHHRFYCDPANIEKLKFKSFDKN